ncbi:gliding motility protein GldL [Muribaculum caecicola]|uniref:Gliding motility protein GldL n=1 Tax=Muribaculum caecicola TaxID=3038144 RepID=A0AC61S570_9BACT|nr:gliding motility protein GldL [Muribaculum caecicola]THG48318.1 gliding motility protein GldL [Muribaculum caecicola]
MGKYKRYKNSVERFLSSEKGQRFFNFAYSIGAAIVIWGALFKILHLPGGSTLLSIGMGTEVLMFILTAFDRPPREYHWEEVFPVLSSKKPEDRPEFGHGGTIVTGVSQPATANAVQTAGTMPQLPADATPSEQYAAQMTALSEQMEQLRTTTQALNSVSEVLLQSYRSITENSENITRNSAGYVEEMQNLNRNIAGLNTIYSIQLKSVSSQLDSIDRVNQGMKDIRDMYEKSSAMSQLYCEETEKMARNMKHLNAVYEKMLHAMTINMYNPMAAPQQTAVTPNQQTNG